jgi:hypothetical protein
VRRGIEPGFILICCTLLLGGAVHNSGIDCCSAAQYVAGAPQSVGACLLLWAHCAIMRRVMPPPPLPPRLMEIKQRSCRNSLTTKLDKIRPKSSDERQRFSLRRRARLREFFCCDRNFDYKSRRLHLTAFNCPRNLTGADKRAVFAFCLPFLKPLGTHSRRPPRMRTSD